MPSAESRRTAVSPSSIIGTFTTMFSASRASSFPSRYMSSAVSDTTSADTGPSTA